MKSLLIAIALINFYGRKVPNSKPSILTQTKQLTLFAFVNKNKVASINASPLDKVYNAYLQNTEDNSNQIGKHQGGRHQNHQSHQPFRAINGANDDDNAAGDDDDDDEDRLMTFLSQTFSPQFVRHLEHADLTDYNGDDDEDDGDIFEDKNEPNRILKRSNHLKG